MKHIHFGLKTLREKNRCTCPKMAHNGRTVGAVRIINEKINKMNESVIIQKLIQVGQMLERGELEYSGAEIDTKHYLEQYVALRQPPVSVRSEQLACIHNVERLRLIGGNITCLDCQSTWVRQAN